MPDIPTLPNDLPDRLVKHAVQYAHHQDVDWHELPPMMRHYVEMKSEHQNALLLYRMGDFFECFFEDAITVARELELVLTSKESGKNVGRVPMAGVPHKALDSYCAKLVEKGYAIAICDQIEDAAQAQGLVRREITRIITPGTLLEEGMLNARRNNFLAAVVIAANHWGLAHADISTGEFRTTQSQDLEQLAQELLRLYPSEILLPTSAPDLIGLLRPEQKAKHLPEGLPTQFCYTLRPQSPFTSAEARQRLIERFRVKSLEGMGCEHLPLAVRAAGGLLEYLEDTSEGRIQKLQGDLDASFPLHPSSLQQIPLQLLHTYALTEYLILDHQTRRNLEIIQTVRDGSFHGSLLWALDQTVTTMGGRTLRRWLLQPLLDVKKIAARQDTIEELLKDGNLRQDLRKTLREIYDLERLTGRAGSGTANARDLVALADSLSKLPDIADRVAHTTAPYLTALQTVPAILEQLAQQLHQHLVETPPASVTEGGLIRPQINPQLDELRHQTEGDRQWIANLETIEREQTAIPNLKVGYNKTFGYYISISRSKADQVPDHYIRKQTLTTEERYITPDLKERENRVLTAQTALNQLEYEIFTQLRTQVGEQADLIRTVAQNIAAIDVLAAFAEIAEFRGYTRPQMVPGRSIHIQSGRHPVVEQSLPIGFFVPNSTSLGEMNSEFGISPSETLYEWNSEVGSRKSEVPTPSPKSQTLDSQSQTPNSKLQTPNSELQTPNSKLRTPNSKLQTPNSKLRTPNSEPNLPNSELRTPNSEFSPDLIILTGPNASGKSCYLRQIGLIQLMAQVGSFVPAQAATLALCDRIFTRVGAVDDLATGQSTFMVEMNETANILNHATPQSLVLLDEIGRGTATFDGLSIAWSVAEYLATEIRSRTIFATHYHELNELASLLPNVANFQVTVKELPDQIIFLHQVQPGGADRSYGIEAARLAGLPPSVIQRAKQVMKQIEKHSKIAMGLRKGTGTGHAPAASDPASESETPLSSQGQLDIF
jgi:DNA mismatch repair protein MutS